MPIRTPCSNTTSPLTDLRDRLGVVLKTADAARALARTCQSPADYRKILADLAYAVGYLSMIVDKHLATNER